MVRPDNTAIEVVKAEVETLSQWLRRDALPLQLRVGLDRERGGFFERIGQNGVPVSDDNRRARVQPRQVYCFAMAKKIGLPGDWAEGIESGLVYFEQVYRLPFGIFGALANCDGTLIDDSFDLYNQAFALFGYAAVAQVYPARQAEMREKAETLLDSLIRVYHHPVAGFEEDMPVKLPLCSNPHMHLFEACLAWNEILKGQGPWGGMADEIANLAMDHFIDPVSGGLREFFDHDWAPYPGEKGRIMEPGHQFEWAWLLTRWGQLRGNAKALSKAKAMFRIGEDFGLSADRHVAIMSLYDDFTVHDSLARLWPQTEWLKASLRLASLSEGDAREAYLQSAIRACKALGLFLQTPIKGLWFDKLPDTGVMVDEPAPASTFYHIVCAILEAEDMLTLLRA
jgi:mannose-6-phosphate isomerase